MTPSLARRFALVAGSFLCAAAAAQSFPTKPVRLIVPFPPGGATDTFARTSAAELTRSLGQQVIVENRPGAGTTIAADFAAVAPVNLSPLLLVAHPSVGARTMRDLVAMAKKHPGITSGHSGVGTVTHMTAEKLRMRAGIEITPVAYKGGATPVIALLGGEIAMVMATVPASVQYVRSGKLVALGLAAERRSSFLPDIPTIGETIKGVDGAVFSGVLAPAGTPQQVVQLLNAEFARASESPKAREVYATNAAEVVVMSPSALAQRLERDVKVWAEVVKATGVRAD